MHGLSVRLAGLGVALLAVGCGGDGGSGGTGPCSPRAATQLVTKSGDGQSWYFNNPLPAPLRVTALDAASCPVPGVVVNWAVGSGDGAINPAQSTTDANGVAATKDSVGSATIQTVSATSTGLAGAATFTEHATTAPATAGVAVADFSFTPADVVIKTGGTVTWTWSGGNAPHNVTYDGGPTPLPQSSGAAKTSGTFQSTITPVGQYTYKCTVHPTQMTGSVTVVH